MHISWSFLDKRKAAISAIQAYSSMDFILKHSDEDLKEVQVRMEGVGSPLIDGMPHKRNPGAAENRLITCIEEIDTIKERYRQAAEYMSWFRPAWNQLTEDEQYVLEAFYMDDSEGVAMRVADYFGIERSSAYNKKNKALEHLSILLYGKL